MSPHKTISVNGRVYDAVTGLPLDEAPQASDSKKTTAAQKDAPKPRRPQASAAVHSSAVQRSQTLNRRVAKKPASLTKQPNLRPAAGRHMDIAKHAKVARFAPHPVTTAEPAKKAPVQSRKAAAVAAPIDKPAQVHPTVERALAKTTAKKPAVTAPVSAKQVKEVEIAKALAKPKDTAKKKAPRLTKKTKKVILFVTIVIVLAAIVFGVYKFFPAISVRIAASQAGISASYPEFTPDGYSLSQPVTYKDGEVDLKFVSNSNDNYYTITQTRNSWDSSAVLDNVVTPAAGANYSITKERGLTIYTYEASAVWVNGGVLYKIDSKAPLSGEQIRRIATSL